MHQRKLWFVRTFKFLKGGGPVPPLGLLSLAAVVRERFAQRYEIRILDTGILGKEAVRKQLASGEADIVGFSVMSCEDDLLHELAGIVKAARSDTLTLAGGPHATVAGEDLLGDANLDLIVLGEAEESFPEILDAYEDGSQFDSIAGLVSRQDGERVRNPERSPIENLDDLPFPAWDLIDMKDYAAFANWNGALKADYYAVLSSSRGCPYGCYFCHNLFGKRVRARSADSVFNELKRLYEEFGVREVHVLDDIFNFNAKRAKEIMTRVIDSGMDLSFAFPNGLRADIMTDELIELFYKAGTYKVNYGFETASPRLQKVIGKNLNVEKASEVFEKTSKIGILTGAYFMFGFPTQTREEILDSIDFAVRSSLDAAYFFKATPYPGSGFFEQVHSKESGNRPENFAEYHFFSYARSYGELDVTELNELILLAQERFVFSFRRLWRGFIKAPKKWRFLRGVAEALVLGLQAFLVRRLMAGTREGKKT